MQPVLKISYHFVQRVLKRGLDGRRPALKRKLRIVQLVVHLNADAPGVKAFFPDVYGIVLSGNLARFVANLVRRIFPVVELLHGQA